MIHPIDLNETYELRDAAGKVVGYLLPVHEFQARLEGLSAMANGQTAGENAEQKCQQLTAECERLRTELAKVRQERDDYLKTVYALLRDHPKYSELLTFTREDILAGRGQHPTFEELVAEIERETRGKDDADTPEIRGIPGQILEQDD